jgi:hypothetical protein
LFPRLSPSSRIHFRPPLIHSSPVLWLRGLIPNRVPLPLFPSVSTRGQIIATLSLLFPPSLSPTAICVALQGYCAPPVSSPLGILRSPFYITPAIFARCIIHCITWSGNAGSARRILNSTSHKFMTPRNESSMQVPTSTNIRQMIACPHTHMCPVQDSSRCSYSTA